MTRSRLDQALALAAVGLKIFPLPRLSKEPMSDVSWAAMMTSDPEKIRAFFVNEPDMNYGVNPGEHFIVIDLDEKNGRLGITNFTELNMEQSADDWCLDTFTVTTPSGGKHLYMRSPYGAANSASKIGSGIDVRGVRGYVVGPGCVTDERMGVGGKLKQFAGSYTVETETEFCEAPQWLLNGVLEFHEKRDAAQEALIELDLPANVEAAREFLATRAPAIEGSGGDEFTYKTCAKLKDMGISEDTALGLMLEARGWNSRCEPSWSATELAAKMRNAFSYGQNAAGNKGELWDAPGAFSAEEYLSDLAVKKETEKNSLADHLFSPDRIANSKEHREMVIPEWLPATGFTALLASRGTGKTVQMMDMACRISCDLDWHDMPIMEDFAVIYICGEDDIGARDQFRAWVIDNDGIMPDPDRFFFMDTTFDLLNAQNVEMWVRFLKEQIGSRRAVVFVDTWQRATSAGAQNDDVDMQRAVHHAEAVARSFRGPAVIAFHPPKSDATVVLGSSVIENSSTAIWTLVKETEGRKLTVSRIKGKGHGNYQTFEYREINLGDKDVFGRDITGVTPRRVGGTTTAGSFEQEQKISMARDMYAAGIRTLILRAEEDPEFAHRRGTAFTIKDTAQRLMGLDAQDEVVQGICEFAQETFVSEAALTARLKFLFMDKGRLFDYGDGTGVLTLEGDARPRFKLKGVGAG